MLLINIFYTKRWIIFRQGSNSFEVVSLAKCHIIYRIYAVVCFSLLLKTIECKCVFIKKDTYNSEDAVGLVFMWDE